MRLAEYLIECDHCGVETRVTVINKTKEEPYHCPMCGYGSVWKKNSNIFTYTITGNSFLRNMVRNLVGVQLAFNDNKLTLKEIKSQLDKPDGNRLNYIAPANGLTLWKVKY